MGRQRRTVAVRLARIDGLLHIRINAGAFSEASPYMRCSGASEAGGAAHFDAYTELYKMQVLHVLNCSQGTRVPRIKLLALCQRLGSVSKTLENSQRRN